VLSKSIAVAVARKSATRFCLSTMTLPRSASMRTCQQFLKSGSCKLQFKWVNKKTLGVMDYDRNTITLNILLMVVGVYVHEWIHHEHPDWSEERVEKSENRRMRKMTAKEIKSLGKEIVLRMWR
jgi:hypothetical protein